MEAAKIRRSSSSMSSASIKQRVEDERYFMGSYGTFRMDSIHGRLFELQVYVESMKYHTFCFFAFVLVALLVWPIAALLAIPVAYIAGPDRDLQMFKVFLVIGSMVGAVLWSLPLIIVSLGGGVHRFLDLIFVQKELNFLDFIDFFLSELMILLFMVFSWMYHEISIDTCKYKESAKESWRSRHEEYGMDVTFPKAQMERLTRVLDEEVEGRVDPNDGAIRTLPEMKTHYKDSSDKELEQIWQDSSEKRTGSKTRAEFDVGPDGGTLFIEDVVRILEVMPGWDSPVPFAVEDNHKEHIGQETGLFSALADLSEEAKEKNLWPLDIWLVREQFYPKTAMPLKEGIQICAKNAIHMLTIVSQHIRGNSLALVVLTSLAIIRTLLPRFWLKYVLGGSIWPGNAFGPSGAIVGFSTMVSFIVSFAWLGLFYFVLMEYRRNLCQVVVLTSCVDARTRVVWSQSYLMSSFWFGMDDAESERVLAKMPLLDLRVSSNVAAFWRLREYVTLDRSNERMGISILLEIVIIWLFMKFAATVITISFSQTGLPAVLIVTLFDLVVFGGMVIVALNAALKLNSIMEQHKQVFVEAKYEVSMAHGLAIKEGLSQEKLADLLLARRLLTEYLDMSNEYDTRDAILFGMIVTPGKLMSSLASVTAAITTLFIQAMRSGQVKVPREVADNLETSTSAALTAIRATVKFLSHRHLALNKDH